LTLILRPPDTVEIRANDLRFPLKETATFLNTIMKLNLTVGNLNDLDRHTEGWIVGLQMVAIFNLLWTNHQTMDMRGVKTCKYWAAEIFFYSLASLVNGCSFHSRPVSRIGRNSQGRLRAATNGRCGLACGPAISSPKIMNTSANIIPE
jgi:hypothetical protein